MTFSPNKRQICVSSPGCSPVTNTKGNTVLVMIKETDLLTVPET